MMAQAFVRCYGPLEIDLAGYRVFLQGRPLALPYREYALLVYLSNRPGQIIPKRQLLVEVFGRHDPGGTRKVDEQIRHLKIQIERSGHEFIQRSRDEGYSFVIPQPA
jgi:DNA-binding response OmpR family regulator